MPTVTGNKGGVMRFRDPSRSPALGKSMWENCPILEHQHDPSFAHFYRNHFHTYAAADWTISTTEAGAGSATEAITDEQGGVLLVTNAAGDNDSDALQHVGEAFSMVSDMPCWIEAGVKISDATQSDFLFGLCITDTTLIDGMTDGVFFQKDDGDTKLDYHSILNSTETGSTGATGFDVVSGAYFRPGIYWDGGKFEFWVNGEKYDSTSLNVPGDELLRISIELQNGEAVAKTLSWDYVWAYQVLNTY